MRMVTSARLRAVGFLLLEAAGLAIAIAATLRKDTVLKESVVRLVQRARAL